MVSLSAICKRFSSPCLLRDSVRDKYRCPSALVRLGGALHSVASNRTRERDELCRRLGRSAEARYVEKEAQYQSELVRADSATEKANAASDRALAAEEKASAAEERGTGLRKKEHWPRKKEPGPRKKKPWLRKKEPWPRKRASAAENRARDDRADYEAIVSSWSAEKFTQPLRESRQLA